MKKLISRLTMKRGMQLFVDIVNGKDVYSWKDRYGIEWMASGKFGFRTERKTN